MLMRQNPTLKRRYDLKTRCNDRTNKRESISECIVCGAPARLGDPHALSVGSSEWENVPEYCIQDSTLKVWPLGKRKVLRVGSKACWTWLDQYVDQAAQYNPSDPSEDIPPTTHDVRAVFQSIRKAAEAERGGSLAWRPSP
jgi:hypothetical protein